MMKQIPYIIGVILFSMVLLSACNKIENNEINEDSEKIKIVTTIFPLYEFAKEVGGETVEVTLLLPPGSEPHSFEPRPSDIKTITNADIFLYIGAEMEPWAHDILEGIENPQLNAIEVSKNVSLQKTLHQNEHEDESSFAEASEERHEDDDHHGEYDPHIWLNFENDQKIIETIKRALVIIDPENEEMYKKNSLEYKNALLQLDITYKESLANCKHNTFITGGHNAYAYLVKKYNLHFVSAYGLAPDSEPTPQTMKEIIDISKEKGVKYILVEKIMNPRISESIAEETGAQTLILNPGHNLSKTEFENQKTFLEIMKENLITLQTALECEM